MIQVKAQKYLHTSNGKQLLDISFELEKGDFVTIFGVSGAGKTTTLRMLAGLTQPDSGEIKKDNNVWFSSNTKTNISIQKRSIGFVFQDLALFPHLNIRKNLEFALIEKNAQNQIDEVLEIMNLGELQLLKPHQLSGGQKQRVALARAIVRRPEVLILDEPLTALDDDMRSHLQDYILEIHKKYQLTTIMVTHNISEIFKLSNKTIHIENGLVKRFGTPHEIFNLTESENNFEIIGEIVCIRIINSKIRLDVLINNQLKIIQQPITQIDNFSVGDKILITQQLNDNLLKKIETENSNH